MAGKGKGKRTREQTSKGNSGVSSPVKRKTLSKHQFQNG